MRPLTREWGFTLVEILVSLAVILIIATITTLGFQNFSRQAALKTGAQEVYIAFTDSRTKTLASEGDTVYGVHLSTSSVTRFSGSVYAAGSASNETYTFEGGVTATSSLIDTGTDVVFARLMGTPSATGTIYLMNSAGDATTTLTLHGSGLIEYE